MRGQAGRAHRALDVAEAEGGEPADGVLPTRLDLALAAGDESLAEDVLARLRVSVREDALIALDHERVAGVLKAHGDLRGALRWHTMPFTHAEPDDTRRSTTWTSAPERGPSQASAQASAQAPSRGSAVSSRARSAAARPAYQPSSLLTVDRFAAVCGTAASNAASTRSSCAASTGRASPPASR